MASSGPGARKAAAGPAGRALPPLDAARPSLTERTIEAVRLAVRTGRLAPGELYSVYRLADELGVSRSPVREALLRLTGTGLIAFERNRGFRVVLPSAEDLLEIFAMRLDLEVPAAGRAAAAASPDLVRALTHEITVMADAAADGDEAAFMSHDQHLHAALLRVSGNRRVETLVDTLRDATRLVGASTVGSSRTLRHVHSEHVPVVEAVMAGDVGGARSAMHHHLARTGELLLGQVAPESPEVLRRWRELC